MFNLSVLEFIGHVRQALQELTVVRNDDERALIRFKRLFQHILGLHIQVVGWLVQNEHVDRIEHQLTQGQSTALPTRKDAYFFLDIVPGKHKVAQQFARRLSDLFGAVIFNRRKHRFTAI